MNSTTRSSTNSSNNCDGKTGPACCPVFLKTFPVTCCSQATSYINMLDQIPQVTPGLGWMHAIENRMWLTSIKKYHLL